MRNFMTLKQFLNQKNIPRNNATLFVSIRAVSKETIGMYSKAVLGTTSDGGSAPLYAGTRSLLNTLFLLRGMPG